MGIKFHKNPKERRWFEKIARRFILPPHPPFAMAWNGWTKREERLKRCFPIRWFIWETVPDLWNYKVRNRIHRARNWIRFRTYDRYHLVDTGLEPNYYDPDHRMLHANFQILVDYVEIELAAMNLAMGEGNMLENMSTGWKLNKFRKLYRKFRRDSERLPEEGLKHLDWEIEECALSNPSQAESAKEKKLLYLWWTVWRNERVDPLTTPLIWGKDEDITSPFSVVTSNKDRSLYKLSTKLEEFYLAEDDEMLARLVKIRRSLWI